MKIGRSVLEWKILLCTKPNIFVFKVIQRRGDYGKPREDFDSEMEKEFWLAWHKLDEK